MPTVVRSPSTCARPSGKPCHRRAASRPRVAAKKTPGLRLLRVVQRQVVVGQPLPGGVRDEHGNPPINVNFIFEGEEECAGHVI